MENWKKKAVELITNLALSYKAMPAVIGYTPAKTATTAPERKSLKRSTPEKHGVPSSVIYSLLTDLEAEERANVHSIVIVKDGEVITECSRRGYGVNLAHLSHSMTKTVMGMIIGLLFDDGFIEVGDKVCDFFPELTLSGELRELTVEHLLIMCAGIGFGEVGTVTEEKWAEAFFESPLEFSLGKEFHYNSMNSYVLACIADRILRTRLGITVTEYLTRRIFRPMGIDNFLWETDREGVVKGGWGLYLSTESWAKLGLMMQNYGMYGGRRILSERWINESIRCHSITPEATGDFNYGYHLWVGREDGDFLFNGMLGQNVWVCPKNNIVVALSSGNNELFQQSPALAVIKKHLGGDIPKPASGSRIDAARLKEKTESFFSVRSWLTVRRAPRRLLPFLPVKHTESGIFKRLCGSYTVARNNQGILPLLVRVMQNNYQGGIQKINISLRGDHLLISSVEGGVDYEFSAGIYGYKTTSLDFCGEKYLVSAAIEASENEAGGISYKLELVFPELPNTRRIILTLGEDRVMSVKMSEIPDEKMVSSFIESFASSGKATFVMDLLEKNLGKNFIENKLHEMFYPELVAVREDAPEYEAILAAENGRVEAKIASSALIRMLIYKFIGNEEPPAAEGRPTNILSSILGKFFG